MKKSWACTRQCVLPRAQGHVRCQGTVVAAERLMSGSPAGPKAEPSLAASSYHCLHITCVTASLCHPPGKWQKRCYSSDILGMYLRHAFIHTHQGKRNDHTFPGMLWQHLPFPSNMGHWHRSAFLRYPKHLTCYATSTPCYASNSGINQHSNISSPPQTIHLTLY